MLARCIIPMDRASGLKHGIVGLLAADTHGNRVLFAVVSEFAVTFREVVEE